jgi:hypothetical protein
VQVTELPLFLNRIGDTLASKGAAAAANAMAAEFHAELVNVTLRKSSHARGEVTASKPGSPPALVSGTLRRSARIVPAAVSGTRAVSSVRMGAVYARAQEKGAVIRPKRGSYLKFQYPAGSWHSVRSVTLPARPYMKPTLDLLRATGRLRSRAAQAVTVVVREGAAGE